MQPTNTNTSKNQNNSNSTQALVAANIRFLVEQLEGGHSEVLTNYLNVLARFHTYSFGNLLLIARQRPDATRVAGMYAWNQLGRRVKKGEKGIQILAPMVGRKRKNTTEPNRENSESANTNAVESKNEWQLVGFRRVFVWDVAATEGKDLPQLDEVKGDVGENLERLIAFVQSQEIKLDYSRNIAPAKGVSYGGAIRLLPNMEPAETLATLVHELSHELLHKIERRTMITKTVRETEAEAIAFVVCKAVGLETGRAASDYIALYHGNAKLLRESLEIVQRTAAVILGAIAPPPPAEKTQEPEEAEVMADGVSLAMAAEAQPWSV